MEYVIENEFLKVTVNQMGCEITDITSKKNNKKYLWNGNPEAWKRHSPVLFPLIGRYKDDTSIYDDKAYHMGQHGFARDMEFSLVAHSNDEIIMKLTQTPETLEKYPFNFELECGYKLQDNEIKVIWKVHNTNEKTMHFSLGGHPAFIVPKSSEEATIKNAIGCKVLFKKNGNIVQDIQYNLLNENGLVMPQQYNFNLTNGEVEVTQDFFDKDAYIIENTQADEVSLIDKTGEKFITVKFDTPVFGVWSAANKSVPFVCIEPWYGRADDINSDNQLQNRKWGNTLQAGEVFDKNYTIQVH